MNNSTIYAVITYLIIFRVAIILVGGVSIVLGYKLFVRGIFAAGSDNPGASMEAKLGGYEVSMKNAAPGTFFALFGSIVIGAMILSSPPEVQLEQRSGLPTTQQDDNGAANTGAGTETISRLTARGDKNADTLHREAWDHLDRALNATKRAVELERTSKQSEKLNDYLDTLAAISFIAEKDKQSRKKALEQMPVDADFRKLLQEFFQLRDADTLRE
ncbi:hypothetical protein [Neptunomonas antarctica]|uniref:Uncharacterized protein n=1 Tax=Neptunomonas antarctica TaxID=619304 RepID=A0A1N7K3U4_9GAMM|nr:hypothetical protein [Neptunomonas antarctica]SIS56239.1 hypothetical protein SAMN05421760_102178 [Neptunomonas antarctica]